MGQALQMYTQAYGFYPGACAGGSAGGYALWPVRLRPFTGLEQRVFHCPARDESFEWRTGRAGSGPPATAYYARFGYEPGEPMLDWASASFSYGYNMWGTQAGPSPPVARQLGLGNGVVSPDFMAPAERECFRELRASRVKLPSEMIAIADSASDAHWDFAIVPDAGYGMRPYLPINPADIHRGGPNVLFCDGHVQWHPLRDLLITRDVSDPADRARRRMWNNDHEEHLSD